MEKLRPAISSTDSTPAGPFMVWQEKTLQRILLLALLAGLVCSLYTYEPVLTNIKRFSFIGCLILTLSFALLFMLRFSFAAFALSGNPGAFFSFLPTWFSLIRVGVVIPFYSYSAFRF